jgi:hypothetical protein
MPRPHQSRARQFHHAQAHGSQPDPQGTGRRKVAAWDDEFLVRSIPLDLLLDKFIHAIIDRHLIRDWKRDFPPILRPHGEREWALSLAGSETPTFPNVTHRSITICAPFLVRMGSQDATESPIEAPQPCTWRIREVGTMIP